MSTTSDFTFAWEGAEAHPWTHLQVVRFHGREELSQLYRYELTLLAKAPDAEIDPHDLVGARATLRISTLTRPASRVIHGVIAEAEEIAPVPEGMLYRVTLMPPLVRARHRTRCRIFLEKTTRAIINTVLQGDVLLTREDGATAPEDDDDFSSFTPAAERFTWRITHPARIDNVSVRPYCVQYNESDLAFVSRILEEEGISYHFESGGGVCLLVLSDTDNGKTRLDPFEPLGDTIAGRTVASIKLGARLRERVVRLGDYDWRKPALDLLAETRGNPDDLFEYRFPGGYAHDTPNRGDPLAQLRLERFHAEAAYAVGEASCRLLSAGTVCFIDLPKSRYDGEYLITKLEVRGEQPGVMSTHAAGSPTLPFSCTFECVRRGGANTLEESRFRPSRSTPKPRILGSQTAFVTADPVAQGAEIHVGGPPDGEIGCVRLRFHWDLDAERLAREPSSCWVRVNQVFAGVGEGGVWHPRVGVEAIVEFLDGDPDRPIVTGRVYNGRNRPPAPSAGAATVSMFKSFSSPGGGKYNEFSFEDTTGSERVHLHAAKNWDTAVGHDRSESVTNHSTSSVGVHRTESTGGNRTASVKGSNAESVDGDESVAIQGRQSKKIDGDKALTVGASRTSAIHANDSLSVGGDRAVTIAGHLRETVAGSATESITGDKTMSVAGNDNNTVSGNQSVAISGTMTVAVSGAVSRSGSTDVTDSAAAHYAISAGADLGVTAGANLSLIATGRATLQGMNIDVNAAGEITLGAGGSAIKISAAGVEIIGGAVKIAGGSVDVTGGMVKIN